MHSTRMPLVVLLCSVSMNSTSPHAEQPSRIDLTETRIRALTKEAVAEGAGDSNTIIINLDAKVKALNADVETEPLGALVHHDDRITIFLGTPYAVYRNSLIDALRKRNPVEKLIWIPTGFISVSPSQIDSPDIVKVVVERGGTLVPPVRSTLAPKIFMTRIGAKTVVHAGEVHYPMSTFAPGAPVVITAIPESGDNFVLTLDDAKLRKLR